MIVIAAESEVKRYKYSLLVRESSGLLVQRSDGVLEVITSRLCTNGPITDKEFHALLEDHNEWNK